MLRFALKSGSFLLLAAALLCAQQPPPQQQIQGRRPQLQPHQASQATQAPDATQPQATQQPPSQQASPQQVPPQEVPQTQPTLVNGVPVSATLPPPAVDKNHKAQKPSAEVQQQAQAPVEPPKPPTLEQSPATPPQVSYSDGMLSIVSRNSTLGDILTCVRKLTGAAIDAPSTTLSERVATSLGPAPPKDVLASLFNGSRFDYIILGSMKSPGGVDRIILTAKQNGPSTPGAPATAQPYPGQPVRTVQNTPPPEPPEVENEDDNNTPEREQAEEPPLSPEQLQQQQAQPGSPAPGQIQPGQPGAAVPQGAQQPGVQPALDGSTPNADQTQNPQQPKSPEQLLRELQEMQRQKQNDQQNSVQNPR